MGFEAAGQRERLKLLDKTRFANPGFTTDDDSLTLAGCLARLYCPRELRQLDVTSDNDRTSSRVLRCT